jgi:hypothetical protein
VLRIAALCVTVPLVMAMSPRFADAQSGTSTLQIVYWFPSQTFSFGGVLSGVSASWSTPMYGLDYRLDLPSRWGLHLNALTGTENNLTFAGAPFPGSFTDTIWSADLTYRWDLPVQSASAPAQVHVFAGYGGAKTGSLPSTSNGVRLGADGSFPFAAGWSLNGLVAYEPSNNVTITPTPFPSLSATTTAWEYAASVRYTAPSGWDVEGGYRWRQENVSSLTVSGAAICPCTQQWSGFFLQGGYTF